MMSLFASMITYIKTEILQYYYMDYSLIHLFGEPPPNFKWEGKKSKSPSVKSENSVFNSEIRFASKMYF